MAGLRRYDRRVIPTLIRRKSFAAGLGCAAFLLIGWSGLLVPSLTREIEGAFGQTDVGLGLFYFVAAAAYAAGSILGGMATERIGRKPVLVLAATLHAAGLVGLGLAPGWSAIMAAGVLRSLGAGGIDGGVNGLIVDLFGSSRGRVLSFVHLFYAMGAVGAPFLLAFRTPLGLSWQLVVIGTGIATVPLGLLLAVTDLAGGRRHVEADRRAGGSSVLVLPMGVLAVAIGCYVAFSNGVSNWLVRFLGSAPGGTATLALSLFWAGLMLGRLVSAGIADRFDHVKLAIAASTATSAAVFAAVLAPTPGLSIALFAVAGFAAGPVYPLVMAIGGERFPGRSAAMSGILSAAGIGGSLAYPPLMGVISVTAGLPTAMAGTAVFGAGAALALVVVGRMPARSASPGEVAVV
jgi:fucose permease